MAQLQLLAALACVTLASALPLAEPQIGIQEPQIGIQEPQIDEESAKEYLESFGYIKPGELTLYEDALSTFQDTFGLEKTGSLDEATIALMQTPRCGRSDNEEYGTEGKWAKKALTWRLSNTPAKGTLTRTQIETELAASVAKWAAVSQLSFSKVSSGADINVSFKSSSHSPYAFDGTTLAHAFYPSGDNYDGENHFNNAFTFTNTNSNYNFGKTATHELGHNLGMKHTPGSNVMDPYYPHNNGVLSNDDKSGIQSLYGA